MEVLAATPEPSTWAMTRVGSPGSALPAIVDMGDALLVAF